MDKVQWLPIPGYEGFYEASSAGEIRSIARQKSSGGILVQQTKRNGRRHVRLCREGQIKTHLVHRLVAAAFLGSCPDGLEVCHGDGDPSNNEISNLRYDTRSANQQDSLLHGTNGHAKKERCPRGHEYSPENTYRQPSNGSRLCRACMPINKREWRARVKQRA